MSWIQKITILSVSFLMIMANSAMSPILADLGEHFHEVDPLYIKMIMTLPALFIIPMTIFTGRLIFFISKKHLLYIGLTLYVVGGSFGAIFDNIVMLLIFRSFLGIGLGILLPLSTTLIADFFEGHERSKMMGYSTAFKNLGAIIATIISGFLVLYSWRYPFMIYLVGFVTLILVFRYLPDQAIPPKTNYKPQISKNVWILGLSHFMVIQAFYAVPASLSEYVKYLAIGTGFTSGLLISLVTIGSFIFASFFHQIKQFLKGHIVLFGLLLLSSGMLVTGFSSDLLGIAIGLVFVGLGLGVLAPNIYLQTSLDSAPLDVTLSLAIVSSFSYLGQFASPIIIKGIQQVLQINTPSSPFIIAGVIGLISMILVVINIKLKVYVPKPTNIV